MSENSNLEREIERIDYLERNLHLFKNIISDLSETIGFLVGPEINSDKEYLETVHDFLKAVDDYSGSLRKIILDKYIHYNKQKQDS